MIVRQPMSTFQHYASSLSGRGRNPPEADMLTEATDTAAACELLITPYPACMMYRLPGSLISCKDGLPLRPPERRASP